MSHLIKNFKVFLIFVSNELIIVENEESNTNKSYMKYRVHKIEHNYNQIWHGIKANKNIVVNYNFTQLKSNFAPVSHLIKILNF